MTKVTPVTKLPIYTLRLSWLQPEAGEVNISEDRLRQMDAYVLHAANAYPRLVEVVWAYLQTASNPKGVGKLADIDAHARALLRSLGEV